MQKCGMNKTPKSKAESIEPRYHILSDGGAGNCWKIEYHNVGNRFAAQRQADTDKAAHGGQWIVAEDWSL